MLGHIGVCTQNQHAPIRIVSTGGPDFLAIDYPFVSISFGSGTQRSKVTTAGRFAEKLAPDVFATGKQW